MTLQHPDSIPTFCLACIVNKMTPTQYRKQKLYIDRYERAQRHDNPIDVSTSHSSKASRKRRKAADEDIQQTREVKRRT